MDGAGIQLGCTIQAPLADFHRRQGDDGAAIVSGAPR